MTLRQKPLHAFGGKSDIKLGIDFLRVIGFDRSYAEGFLKAAETIVRSIKSGPEIHFTYQMVLPACFLYRHYVELQLKRIIALGTLTNVTVPKKTKTHTLADLWNDAKEVIEKLFDREYAQLIGPYDSIIMQFHHIDPLGQEFRYHKRTDGAESLKHMPRDFSLGTLYDAMVEMQIFLGDTIDILEAKADCLT